jgi:hypothetical protein
LLRIQAIEALQYGVLPAMRALVLACVLLVASVSGECSKAGKYDAEGKIQYRYLVLAGELAWSGI